MQFSCLQYHVIFEKNSLEVYFPPINAISSPHALTSTHPYKLLSDSLSIFPLCTESCAHTHTLALRQRTHPVDVRSTVKALFLFSIGVPTTWAGGDWLKSGKGIISTNLRFTLD